MRISHFCIFVVGACLSVACTESVAPTTAIEEYVRLNAVSSRSALTRGTAVAWLPTDDLSVFDEGGNHRFTTSSHGASAEFGGLATMGAAYRMALYPYDKSAVADMSAGTVRTSLPSVQTGVPASFADGANVSAGIVRDGSFTARNIGGLVCLTLGRKDIVKVVFSSLDPSVSLSGSVRISFDGDGIPETETLAGENSVTLVPASCLSSLEKGTYFLSVLPCTLTEGYRLELTCQDGYVATVESHDALAIGRSRYLDLGTVDADMPEDRAVIIFGDSITHNNVFQWLNTVLASENTPVARYRAVLAGRSGETPSQITARQGGIRLFVKGPLCISADASVKTPLDSLYIAVSETGEALPEPVRGIGVDMGGESTTRTWTGCVNPFRIAGVLCQITGSPGNLAINRVHNAETDLLLEDRYIEVETLARWKYSDAWAQTCYMGTNGEGVPTKIPYNHDPGEWHSYEDLARFYELALNARGAETRFLVLGFHNTRWNEATRDCLAKKFGDIFVDLRTVGYTDAGKLASEIGVTLDETDYQYIARKEWPWSWQDASNTIHPSPAGHKVYAQIVFDRMKALGWFEDK